MEFKETIRNLEPEIIKSIQESIKIKSVEETPVEGKPFGQGPYNALVYMLKLGENMGFKTKNFDGYAGHIDFGDGDETVGVLAHVDVVPEGDGWTYPPFGGEIHNGRIYGRGTMDDKGPAVIALYAMKALKDIGFVPDRRIRLILGANEESRWECMKHYFKNEEPPTMAFTPDADFPVIHGEKGIIGFDFKFPYAGTTGCDITLLDIKGGNATNMVPDKAWSKLKVADKELFISQYDKYLVGKDHKISIEETEEGFNVTALGISAHGSTPAKGENAISYLIGFLGYIYSGQCPVCRFINFYNERIAFKHHGEDVGCGLEDELSGKLDFNPGLISYDGKDIILSVNVRYPISSSAEEVFSGIRESIKETPIELVEGSIDSRPLYVSKDNELVKTLMKVYREQTGDMDSEPITIGGGTYARAMKNAVAFGPVFPGQEELAHQKDEHISIDNIIKLTEIYAHALFELAKH
ncbi:dipeptidase PepV [Gudongella sp. DL1XJH-153]|uniref:dipeptidase PepV n=1 Tax=Gudongella sp. DL1XJH-153 TaxID=3409804 RepID=UPI003BB49C09